MPVTHSRGVGIAWNEHGQGDPLLLIMGHRFSSRLWHWTLPALAESRRVITFDNRGTGGSDAPRGPYTMQQLADDALAVLDAAEVDRADVYGVSMGGMIALEMALNRPERVRSLVLGCTSALSPDKKRPPRASYVQYWLPRTMLLKIARGRLYGPVAREDRIRRDMALLADDRFSPRGLAAQARAIATHNCLHRMSEISQPALVLHGSHDAVIPVKWGEELAAALPNGRLVILSGAGHNYLADAADESNTEVLAFLDDVAAPLR